MQHAPHRLLTATRLCEMNGTLYAFLAAGGSLGSNNSTVYVVDIDAMFVMPKFLFCSCTSAMLHCTFCSTSNIDAAESTKAVVFW